MIYCDNFVDFSQLLGKTLVDIQGAEVGNDEIIFTCSDGTKYQMFHLQNCCENVYIEDICGDMNCLLNRPITMAEDISDECSEMKPVNRHRDMSYTCTWYKLGTRKGYVTIRWYGESNGYYSENVDFMKLREEN